MTGGGLFSGIGGFELAFRNVGGTNLWSNDLNDFCCRVLRKNFNHRIIHGDIRKIGKGREVEVSPTDIIFGGFPCQPFSVSGERAGAEDDRYLWPEMHRIITEVRPKWVLAENVDGLLSMDGGGVFEEVQASLESEGYFVESCVLPAIGVGAPHKRNRIWVIAYNNEVNEHMGRLLQERPSFFEAITLRGFNNTDSVGEGLSWRKFFGTSAEGIFKQEPSGPVAQPGEVDGVCDADSVGITGRQEGEGRLDLERNPLSYRGREEDSVQCPDDYRSGERGVGGQWEPHWLEAVTRLCRVDDGLPAWVDRSPTARLEALGNAIVPHLAQIILYLIKQINDEIYDSGSH